MKLLLSCLLLASLCDLSSWSVSSTGTLDVTQTADVSVVEGETVNITCCWTGTFGRVGVYWLKNQREIKNKIRIISTNTSQGCQQKETCNCSTLTFTNITREDEGKYYCKVSVEIPFLTVVKGNGTVITVKDRDNIKDKTEEESFSSSTGNPLPLIITLAVVAPILLLTLVCVCIQAIAARVIYEVPHFDSEVADMDKHSTSSFSASFQWCQVVVYESFNYLEHTEWKQSSQILRQRDSIKPLNLITTAVYSSSDVRGA
ncbi:uncharacterized protein LOC121888973 isoform X2 [Thunnus maccoyii]|uniref:uncharacterized protein LOC121888973 isoform X2 n=1 Tax=Thunnus maccoyii TaxID=8240 RepID=UPI001C4AC208|nr:uncharacterized protein LOC121888973 isoform X2 [Thunnus maccoyii]